MRIRDYDAGRDKVVEMVGIRIESQRLSEAMKTLTDEQCQAIAFAYDGGYSQSEIARLTGVPIGTVKTRLRDGMVRLRN